MEPLDVVAITNYLIKHDRVKDFTVRYVGTTNALVGLVLKGEKGEYMVEAVIEGGYVKIRGEAGDFYIIIERRGIETTEELDEEIDAVIKTFDFWKSIS